MSPDTRATHGTFSDGTVLARYWPRQREFLPFRQTQKGGPMSELQRTPACAAGVYKDTTVLVGLMAIVIACIHNVAGVLDINQSVIIAPESNGSGHGHVSQRVAVSCDQYIAVDDSFAGR